MEAKNWHRRGSQGHWRLGKVRKGRARPASRPTVVRQEEHTLLFCAITLLQTSEPGES